VLYLAEVFMLIRRKMPESVPKIATSMVQPNMAETPLRSFSADYHEARDKFLAAAQAAGATL
jgi:hypothetical protein